MPLDKNAILGAEDSKLESVEVPEWGGTVHIRMMTGTERNAYDLSRLSIVDGKAIPNLQDIEAKLLVRCIADDKGNRLFEDKDVSALGKKSSRVLNRLWDVARKLNGLGDEEAKAISKNSDAATNGG